MSNSDTQLVFSQEAPPPVTMAEIVSQQSPDNPDALVTVGATANTRGESKMGTGAKVGIAGVALALLGLFAGKRRKKAKA